MGDKIATAFAKVCELASGTGHKFTNAPIWEYQIDDVLLEFNGKEYPVANRNRDIAPFTIMVSRDEWPMAIITPHDGCFIACSERAFIELIEMAIKKEKEAPNA